MKLAVQILFIASWVCIGFSSHGPNSFQQPKTATLILTQAEMEVLYQVTDDAAIPGQVRKPLLQKISVAYEAAFAVKQDTSKPVKKN